MKNTSPHHAVEQSRLQIFYGSPNPVQGETIEVDIGSALPSAFSSLRALLRTLRAYESSVIDAIARQHPQEWNQLFPGSIEGSSELSDLALSPSERRLHRESEQVYRTLNVAAKAIVGTLRCSNRQLILRNSGQSDLVSLRGLMRACEWARLDHQPYHIIFADWGGSAALPEMVTQLRQLSHDKLIERLDCKPTDHQSKSFSDLRSDFIIEDFEHSCLQHVVSKEEPALRIAAAILAIRSCFYSTNYEGALLAISNALQQIEQHPADFTVQAVRRYFSELDNKNIAPAIEIDESCLESVAEIKALLWKSIGVVHSLAGDHVTAIDAFNKALSCHPSPEASAQLHMYLGLIHVKKLHKPEEAIALLNRGLSFLDGRTDTRAIREEGWIRNVIALAFFQQQDLVKALAEEKRATSVVGQLRDPQATHLKINLISNMSVLYESAQRYTDAIQIWQRFAAISSSWNTSFWKHHTYRLAGLYLAVGEQEQALQNYREAYTRAKELDDYYHCQVIAAELGQFFLKGGQKDQAAEWFHCACEHAETMGDPFRLGESMVGEALSQDGDPGSGIRIAQLTTTYTGGAQKLLQTSDTADRAALVAVLPKLRTKLNRPFDVVNLNL
jgi:tetratricopeptide (TPR) repeat protein